MTHAVEKLGVGGGGLCTRRSFCEVSQVDLSPSEGTIFHPLAELGNDLCKHCVCAYPMLQNTCTL